jgi:hypothetical protein
MHQIVIVLTDILMMENLYAVLVHSNAARAPKDFNVLVVWKIILEKILHFVVVKRDILIKE